MSNQLAGCVCVGKGGRGGWKPNSVVCLVVMLLPGNCKMLHNNKTNLQTFMVVVVGIAGNMVMNLSHLMNKQWANRGKCPFCFFVAGEPTSKHILFYKLNSWSVSLVLGSLYRYNSCSDFNLCFCCYLIAGTGRKGGNSFIWVTLGGSHNKSGHHRKQQFAAESAY